MIKDYVLLAFANLSHRRVRSWLTMIGIFIGIAAVIGLIGLGEGLRIAIGAQFGNMGSDTLSIQASGQNFGPPGSGAAIPLKDDYAVKISKVNGVEFAINEYVKPAEMVFNNKQDIIFLISVPNDELRKPYEETSDLKAAEGRLLKDGDNRRVLIGHDYSLSNTFGKGIKVGDYVLIKNVKFQVVGILEKKGSFILDQGIYLNEDALLDLIGKDGNTDMISVKVKNANNINQVKDDIEKLLRRERNVKKGEEDFEVQTPQKALASLNSALFAVQLFVYIIAGISILVGGIGIMNTMYTAVLERTKEIGIMKAIGARNSSVFLLFFIESGFLGLVGGIIGILLGLIMAYGGASLGRLALGSDLIRASVSLEIIIGALVFSFGLGTVFGVLPAYRASKMEPVDALRSK